METDTHTDNYRNPRCACAPRINYQMVTVGYTVSNVKVASEIEVCEIKGYNKKKGYYCAVLAALHFDYSTQIIGQVTPINN